MLIKERRDISFYLTKAIEIKNRLKAFDKTIINKTLINIVLNRLVLNHKLVI